MSKSASTTIAVQVQGDGANIQSSDTLQNANAFAPTSVACVSGNNTIPVPAFVQIGSFVRVKIVPTAGSSVPLVLKGVAGDTGIGLNATEPQFLSMVAGTSQFVLNAGGSVTVELYWG